VQEHRGASVCIVCFWGRKVLRRGRRRVRVHSIKLQERENERGRGEEPLSPLESKTREQTKQQIPLPPILYRIT